MRCSSGAPRSPLTVLVDLLGRRTGMGGARRRSAFAAAVELAGLERVLPALGARLIEEGASPLPTEFARFLVARRGAPAAPVDAALVAQASNAVRNDDLREQLVSVLRLLRGEGIATVPLKGAALLDLGLARDRELTDLDLLILDDDRLAEARALLLGAGYRDATPAEYHQVTVLADHHQLRPLVREGRAGSIELHRSVLQSEYDDLFDIDFVARHLDDACTRLEAFALALHAIIHSSIVDQGYRSLEPGLRSAMDVGELSRVEPSVPDRLLEHARRSPPLVRRAIRSQLVAVGVLTPGLVLPEPGFRARWWWRRAGLLTRFPALRRHYRALSLLPFALQRERIEARAGGRLSRRALAVARFRFVLARGRRHLESESVTAAPGR